MCTQFISKDGNDPKQNCGMCTNYVNDKCAVVDEIKKEIKSEYAVECIHKNRHEVEIAPGYVANICKKCAENIYKHIATAQRYEQLSKRCEP